MSYEKNEQILMHAFSSYVDKGGVITGGGQVNYASSDMCASGDSDQYKAILL